jgi:hypothetical protein
MGARKRRDKEFGTRARGRDRTCPDGRRFRLADRRGPRRAPLTHSCCYGRWCPADRLAGGGSWLRAVPARTGPRRLLFYIPEAQLHTPRVLVECAWWAGSPPESLQPVSQHVGDDRGREPDRHMAVAFKDMDPGAGYHCGGGGRDPGELWSGLSRPQRSSSGGTAGSVRSAQCSNQSRSGSIPNGCRPSASDFKPRVDARVHREPGREILRVQRENVAPPVRALGLSLGPRSRALPRPRRCVRAACPAI